MDGLLLIDKPPACTSFDVIRVVRRLLGEKRIGHTGTLDPFATGVLPLCVGQATRLAQYLMLEDKQYEATLRLGIETDTLDRDGQVTLERPVPEHLTVEQVDAVLESLVGPQMQTPPMYSAVKVKGKALHVYAREGLEVERAAREVNIHRLERLAFAPPDVGFRVHCSKGTYVRVLGAQMGAALGTGAHLVALRRTSTGPWSQEKTVSLEHLDALVRDGRLESVLIPPLEMLPGLPRVEADAIQIRRICHGNEIRLAEDSIACHDGAWVRISANGRLLAVATAKRVGDEWVVQPGLVLAPESSG